jgi:uncharacterized protein YoxC
MGRRPHPNSFERIPVQSFALAAIGIAALVIAVVCVLSYRRTARLMDEAQEALRTVNRVALGLERVIAEAEKEIATVRSITDRLTRVSERVAALTEDAVDTVQGVLQPVKRLSNGIGALKAAIVGALAGAAVLRRPRGVRDEPQEEPTTDQGRVGERSAT